MFNKLSAITIISGLILLTGCATTQDFLRALGAPAQVQSEITVLGAIAKGHITSDKVKADIHKFAVDLQQAGNLDASQLVALIPHTGNIEADALIAAGVSFVNSAIAKWGSHNATTLAYVQAVATGLLNAGF